MSDCQTDFPGENPRESLGSFAVARIGVGVLDYTRFDVLTGASSDIVIDLQVKRKMCLQAFV